MFKKNTVFILGAGASFPYGFPLGSELILKIIENINTGVIYLPILDKIKSKYYWNNNSGIVQNDEIENPYILEDFLNHFEKLDIDTFHNENRSAGALGINDSFKVKGHNYLEVRLNQINEFFKLRKKLIEIDPLSIDSFLRNYPTFEKVGKIMIIYSLLKLEDQQRFTYENRTDRDNWYRYILNDLLLNCAPPDTIFNNNLNIITFNYSVDLDFYLYSRLLDNELLKSQGIVTFDAVKEFISKRVHHVYGQIYTIDEINSFGSYFSQHTNSSNTNMSRFLKAVQSKDNIKLIEIERKPSDVYHNLLSNAEEIIIIGFSFDPQNLAILGFPGDSEERGNFLKGKYIKHFDFQGELKGVDAMFSLIGDTFKRTRSIGNNISKAYENELKSYWY